MMSFFVRTIFSKTWWSKYYWIPTTFLLGVVFWLLSGGRKSPLASIFSRINEIEKETKDNISDIESDLETKNDQIDSELIKEKDRIRKETADALVEIRKELNTKSKAMADDTDAINKELNSILED